MTAAFALAMAVVLAGTALFVYLRLSSHLSTALDRELRVRAQDLAALAAGPAPLPASRFIEHGESYGQVLTADGRVVKATARLGGTPLLDAGQRVAARRQPTYFGKPSVPGLDEPSRLFASAVGPRILVVGATTQDRAETLAELRNELLIAGPIALLLASAAGYLLAGFALRPVETMRRRAAEISADTAGERLPVPETGDELERLGETLNEMLDRLEAALERERGFVADAGHELRTPLTILRTELELALRQAGSVEELKAAIGRSAQEVDRLSQLAEDLLLIARSEDGEVPLRVERVDVDELFAAVVRRVELRAEAEGKRVTATPAGTTVQGDRIRLEQALVNLVDNGLRYGGRSIMLTAHNSDLHVTDDGPGFPPEFIAHAFERFSRADAARGRGGAAYAANRAVGADVWIALPNR